VKLLTPLDSQYSGAIGLVSIDGMDMAKLGGWLLDRHKIVSTPIIHAEFSGLRVTPNVYTTLDEVDVFSDRMLTAIKNGIA
jgi:isopenicillin-N epimerase